MVQTAACLELPFGLSRVQVVPNNLAYVPSSINELSSAQNTEKFAAETQQLIWNHSCSIDSQVIKVLLIREARFQHRSSEIERFAPPGLIEIDNKRLGQDFKTMSMHGVWNLSARIGCSHDECWLLDSIDRLYS